MRTHVTWWPKAPNGSPTVTRISRLCYRAKSYSEEPTESRWSNPGSTKQPIIVALSCLTSSMSEGDSFEAETERRGTGQASALFLRLAACIVQSGSHRGTVRQITKAEDGAAAIVMIIAIEPRLRLMFTSIGTLGMPRHLLRLLIELHRPT